MRQEIKDMVEMESQSKNIFQENTIQLQENNLQQDSNQRSNENALVTDNTSDLS